MSGSPSGEAKEEVRTLPCALRGLPIRMALGARTNTRHSMNSKRKARRRMTPMQASKKLNKQEEEGKRNHKHRSLSFFGFFNLFFVFFCFGKTQIKGRGFQSCLCQTRKWAPCSSPGHPFHSMLEKALLSCTYEKGVGGGQK